MTTTPDTLAKLAEFDLYFKGRTCERVSVSVAEWRELHAALVAQALPAAEPESRQPRLSISDEMMDLADRLGSEADKVDPRAWGHLLVYAPRLHKPGRHSRATGFVAPAGKYVPPVLFSPYTGEPRDARDIQSDPQGVLIIPPGADLRASPQAAQQAAQAAAGWREQHDRDSAELRSLCQARDVARQERDHARACYASAVKLLTGIHSLLYPAPIAVPDGRTLVFRPKEPDPHVVLQELSDRIRALPGALSALPQPQPQSAQAKGDA